VSAAAHNCWLCAIHWREQWKSHPPQEAASRVQQDTTHLGIGIVTDARAA
jgi:hypothetical protein